ncbi:MAG: hypothetical protein KDA89_12335, partial [Planctomycetaceae bacterium]|nr:hypothetical protein [Planctomycetaceae bacterium]
FLFAANTTGLEQHVAEIKAADLPRDVFRKIAVRLFKEVRRDPVFPSERLAVWVEPVVTCRLSFKDYMENGELDDAKYEAIVIDQPGIRTGRIDYPNAGISTIQK